MRVLLVSDWTVDPHAVVAAATRRLDAGPARFGLLIPAWLHGVDWAGDPLASVPCAERQLDALGLLAGAAGLEVCESAVGDPDPATAISDALVRWPADEILLVLPARRLVARPLDLARRAHRMTGLPVARVAVPGPERARSHRQRRRAGHCVAAEAT
jgi:hypothetical protein